MKYVTSEQRQVFLQIYILDILKNFRDKKEVNNKIIINFNTKYALLTSTDPEECKDKYKKW